MLLSKLPYGNLINTGITAISALSDLASKNNQNSRIISDMKPLDMYLDKPISNYKDKPLDMYRDKPIYDISKPS